MVLAHIHCHESNFLNDNGLQMTSKDRYFLTSRVIYTSKYEARTFSVRTELARSVRKSEGFVFTCTNRVTRLVNSLLYAN